MNNIKLNLICSGILLFFFHTSFAQWGLSGNSISSGQFLGTTNNQPFLIKRNNALIFNADLNNNLLIGTNNTFGLFGGGEDCYVFGRDIETQNQARSFAIGTRISNTDDGGISQDVFSMGRFITNGGYGNFIIGTGVDDANRLSMTGNSGFYIGLYSTIPTFYVGPSSGVNTTGNVGIATTNPGQKLEINGGLKLGNTATASAGSIRYTGSDFEGYTGSSWQSFTGSQWTTSSSNIYNNNAGNVGIGTNSPLTKLHITGHITADAGGDLAVYTGTGAIELNRYMSLLNSPTAASASGLKAGGVLVANDYGYANPGKNDLIVKGNVGIGLTSASAKLHVAGDAFIGKTDARHYLRIASDQFPELRFVTSVDNEVMRLGVSDVSSTYGTSHGDMYLYSSITNRMDLIAKRAGGISLALKGGHVGIGTYDPENTDGWNKVLEVHGTDHAKIIATSSTVQAGLWVHSVGYYSALAGGITGTKTNHPFSIITNGSVKMTVNPAGDVGIGTTSPAYKLHVKGGDIVVTNTSGDNVFKVTSGGYVTARQVDVNLDVIPDYVFEKDYRLMPIAEFETYVTTKKHLPNIKSASEYEEAGSINLGELNLKLLEKVEELSLYIIELNKRVAELEKTNK